MRRLRLLNISDESPEWRWIADLLPDPEKAQQDWRFFSARKRGLIENRVRLLHLGRVRAALQARRSLAKWGGDLVISHGPYMSFYTAAALENRGQRHVAMSFNFTDIPSGAKFKMMKWAFRSIDHFVVFSRMERELYSDLFDIPVERFDFVRWGVGAPIVEPDQRPIAGPYFVALGGEGRDYSTLLAAARRMPTTKFVFIVRPHSLVGEEVPDNVDVKVNLPYRQAWSYVWHSEAALLPLRSSRTPNGHVTAVGTMHLGKCNIATHSIGITDYLSATTAMLVPERDPAAFKEAIEQVQDVPELATRLGTEAQAFARKYCTEAVTIDYFRNMVGFVTQGEPAGR